jgi:CsoR family transcriptional regulator, copper-sensing transcriptional repressor
MKADKDALADIHQLIHILVGSILFFMKQGKFAATATTAATRALSADDARSLTMRLRRAEGQVRAVARLIEEGESCEVVAQQLTAARRALDRTFFEMAGCAVRHGHIAPENLSALLGKYA